MQNDFRSLYVLISEYFAYIRFEEIFIYIKKQNKWFSNKFHTYLYIATSTNARIGSHAEAISAKAVGRSRYVAAFLEAQQLWKSAWFW